MAHLVLVSGGEPGLRFSLDRDQTVLGRDPDCHIVIEEAMVRRDVAGARVASVSRRHAVISRRDGKYTIEDGDGQGKRSRNNTFINDQIVPFPGSVRLHDDDRIRICDFVCTFHREPDSSFTVEHAIDHHSSVQSLQAQTAERLRVLLEISNSLSHTLEIDALLPLLIDRLLELFKQADRGFIILRDETTGQLVPRTSRTRRAGEHPNTAFSRSIVGQCLQSVQAILGNDLPQQFPESESINALPMRSLMCAPLWTQDGQSLGVIQLDSEGPSKKFSPEDLNLLLGVASQASIALSNARLHRDSLLHQAHVRDLELAGKVQRAILPRLPDVPGYEFYAYYQSAQEVGGDYYDFVPLPRQRLAVLLGDVAGKGVAAALVMVKFSVEARACLLTEPEPAAAIRKLSVLMSQAALADRFVTLAVAVLDPASHTITLVNAGHPSPLLVRRAGGLGGAVEAAVPLEVAGPPVGIGEEYASCQAALQPGDSLVLFSDGVTDAQDARGFRFRSQGVRAVLRGGPGSARETGERLVEAVKRHASGRPQTDDIAVVCFGRTGV